MDENTKIDWSAKSNVKVHDNGLIQNLDYDGQLSERHLTKVLENYESYKQASDAAGIPWQMLAAVHHRESGLSTKSRPHGGPFQFDPPLNKGEEDFTVGAFHAARFIQGKSHNRLSVDTKDEHIIKDAFWGYNGRAYGSHDNSPYVMNKFDSEHQDMRIRGSLINAQGERVRIDVADKRMGAYTFYSELQKAFE